MNTTQIIEKAKSFCEDEYAIAKRLYNDNTDSNFYHDKMIIKCALQRCLGVVQFIQRLGVQYEDESWYDEYREKFLNLMLDN